MKSEKKEQSKNLESYTMELKISEDGHALVDQNGKEIARFREGITMRPSKDEDDHPIQWCMHCEPVCVKWDNQGKCIKTVQSCTAVPCPRSSKKHA